MTDSITVTETVQNVIVTNTPNQIIISQVGAQGPSGSASVFYTHSQGVPASTWTINHNLNGYPTAVVFDSANTQCEGNFSYPSPNQMLINFNGAFSGLAYII